MGIYTDALANTKSFDSSKPREGVSRSISREIEGVKSRVDTARAAAYDAANAIHTITADAVDHTGGTFILTLHVTGANDKPYHFATAALNHNVNAATMEGAIDTAAAAAGVPGYVASDISVAAVSTNLQGGNMTLTFDGTSVASRGHSITTMADSRTGGTSGSPVITETAHGNAARDAMSALISTGTVVGAAPTAGSNPSWTAGQRSLGRILSPDTIRALARDAAIADNNDGVYTAVADLYNL